jgi:hypothetical protein
MASRLARSCMPHAWRCSLSVGHGPQNRGGTGLSGVESLLWMDTERAIIVMGELSVRTQVFCAAVLTLSMEATAS